MKRHYRIPLLLCSLCTASLTAVAQNTTHLPTSMYGVGELSAGEADVMPAWATRASP